MNTPLISIITPIYNQEQFVSEAIQSVLNQSYTNWELLIINDGSSDDSKLEIKKFTDTRINYFYQKNQGVSVARNLGLQHMQGDFFCFLDADDLLPENSLKDRIELFLSKPDLSFVDGKVDFYNTHFNQLTREFTPTFKGEVEHELVKLNGSCFVGVSWMIKRNKNINYQFPIGVTHGEDLLFYLSISKGGRYNFVDNPIMKIRTGNISAMSNLKGLEKGYTKIYASIKKNHSLSSSR